jgi:hypothetical protein
MTNITTGAALALARTHVPTLEVKYDGLLCYQQDQSRCDIERKREMSLAFLNYAIHEMVNREHPSALFNLRQGIIYGCMTAIELMTDYSPCTNDLYQLVKHAKMLHPNVAHVFTTMEQEGYDFLAQIENAETSVLETSTTTFNKDIVSLYQWASELTAALYN